MEQMPKLHREDFENLVNSAHEGALEDNAKVDELEARLRELKGTPKGEVIKNYESVSPERVKSFEFPEMDGRTLREVREYIEEKFGDKYYIAGVNYQNFLDKNPDKTPSSMKDHNNVYYYFGTTIEINPTSITAEQIEADERFEREFPEIVAGIRPVDKERWSFLGAKWIQDSSVKDMEDGLYHTEGTYGYKWDSTKGCRAVLIEKNSESPKVIEERVELKESVLRIENEQISIKPPVVSAETSTEEIEQAIDDDNSLESKNIMELDYESIDPGKVRLFLLPEMVGKPYIEVVKYIKEKFGDRYYIPGNRYQAYLNGIGRSKRPSVFDDNKKVNFFGGDDNDGRLSISELVKITGSDVRWGDGEHIVLIEK